MKRLNRPSQFKSSVNRLMKNVFTIGYVALGLLLVSNYSPDLSGPAFSGLSMNLMPNVPEKKMDIQSFPIQEPIRKYGFVIDTFQVEENTIKRNEFLADLLLNRKMDYVDIDQLVKNRSRI